MEKTYDVKCNSCGFETKIITYNINCEKGYHLSECSGCLGDLVVVEESEEYND